MDVDGLARALTSQRTKFGCYAAEPPFRHAWAHFADPPLPDQVAVASASVRSDDPEGVALIPSSGYAAWVAGDGAVLTRRLARRDAAGDGDA